jgi:transcriptional regulator with XRE-family HTH domain
VRPTGEWLNQPGGRAERLQRLRRAAGLTGDQLAAQLGWPRSKIPKLENGRQMPSDGDITAWAQACGQPRAAPELLAMVAEARSVHRQYRHQLRRGGHAAAQKDLDKLVRQASRIRNFEILFVPGLLQTPGYARCRLQEAMRISGDEAQVETAVAARMHRQEVLYDIGREFEFILMETVLLVRSCPDEVMLGQFDRLLGVIGLSNVTLGIIPLDAPLAVLPYTGFMVLDDLTYVETHTSEDLLQGQESAAYERLADELRAESVTGEAARELVTSASERARAFLEGEGPHHKRCLPCAQVSAVSSAARLWP